MLMNGTYWHEEEKKGLANTPVFTHTRCGYEARVRYGVEGVGECCWRWELFDIQQRKVVARGEAPRRGGIDRADAQCVAYDVIDIYAPYKGTARLG